MPARIQRPQSWKTRRHTFKTGIPALVFSGLLVFFCVSANGNDLAQSVDFTDDRGFSIQLDTTPMRIVSLLPSLTETVCVLGACERLVGVDRFSDWPAQVKNLPQLGELGGIQVERLYALQPDIVLAAQSTRVIDRLESLGLTVMALEPQSLDDVERVISLLGELLDLRNAASDLLTSLESEKNKAAALIPSQWLDSRVYFEVASTPYAASEASYIGELLKDLGLGNIVPAELGPFPKLNPEFVVRANPDIILGSENGIASMNRRPGWSALDALEKGHVCAFEKHQQDVLVRPGPRLGEAAAIVAQCIARLSSDNIK